MPDGRVVVAMSGGVDSSVAAALLVEQGYEVVGLPCTSGPGFSPQRRRADAAPSMRWMTPGGSARCWASPHYVFNLRELFEKEVIGNFREEYLKGRTPNPCIVCNQRIKFGALLERAVGLAPTSWRRGIMPALASLTDVMC